MSPLRASMLWVVALVVLAVAGSTAASALAAHETFYDAYTRTT